MVIAIVDAPTVFQALAGYVNPVMKGGKQMERRLGCQDCGEAYACVKNVGTDIYVYYKHRCEEQRCDGVCPVKKETRGLCYPCRRYSVFDGAGIS